MLESGGEAARFFVAFGMRPEGIDREKMESVTKGGQEILGATEDGGENPVEIVLGRGGGALG